jgi:hypothetical protein
MQDEFVVVMRDALYVMAIVTREISRSVVGSLLLQTAAQAILRWSRKDISPHASADRGRHCHLIRARQQFDYTRERRMRQRGLGESTSD